MTLARWLSKALLVVLLTSCAPTSTATPPAIGYLGARNATSAGPDVFVVGVNNGIEEFGPRGSSPIWHTATSAQALAIDSRGYLYASSQMQNFVQVYAPSHVLSYTIDTTDPGTMAFDGSDDLYIGTGGGLIGCPAHHVTPGVISIFPPGKTSATHSIRLERSLYAWAMTFSKSDALVSVAALASGGGCPPRFAFSKVALDYYTNTSHLGRVLSGLKGNTPVVPYLDQRGTLYVLTSLATLHQSASWISVYPSGSRSAAKVIKTADTLYSIGFDQGGHMYVLGRPPGFSTHCFISVYDVLTFKLSRSINLPLQSCNQLAIDNAGDMYVSNRSTGVIELNSNGKLTRTMNAPGVDSMVVDNS